MINGNELVRYFSEIENERYYSDYEIEDLYERAFSEGYEFAQREFAVDSLMMKTLPVLGGM